MFALNEYQDKHISKELFIIHFEEAINKYNVKTMEIHTYGDETEFPQNWYNRIGFKKDNELIIMNGNLKKVLNNLK